MISSLTPEQEQELATDIFEFEDDPEGFVMYAYPWGEGELLGKTGPRTWQRKILRRIGRQLREKKMSLSRIIREAVASGHGIGKSALLAWLIDWGMSTKVGTRGIITAGTETQLKTKTWVEIRKWFRMSVNAHWFNVEETSIQSVNPECKDWRFDRVTWNKSQPEAFAGLHNEGKRILIFFDEASQIDDVIWEVTGGALTDENTDIIWAVFGNPTRNNGAFYRCFASDRNMWSEGHPEQIDSRMVEGTNKEDLNAQVFHYGENSDRVRVRIRGLFPNASSLQFIESDTVQLAMDLLRRPAQSVYGDPLIMGLDVARGGDDNCVIRFRRGMDGRTIPPVTIPGSMVRDSMILVAKVVELIIYYKVDAFFYDGTGVGGPVGNRVRQMLPELNVIEVQFGASSPDPEAKCANMRTYIWAKMRDWLRAGGAVDFNTVLERDLTCVEFDHNERDQMRLEKKEHMKARGEASPDDGDALAVTFAYPVPPKYGAGSGNAGKTKSDWNPVKRRRAS